MADEIQQWTCRWNDVSRVKEWRRPGQTPIPVGAGITPDPPTPPAEQLFPGHVTNRVLIGMATPQTDSASQPGWDSARTIIGQPIYEARRFVGGWISSSRFNSMVGEADAANALGWISFKVPGGSNEVGWGQIRDGVYDSDLVTLFSLIQNYGKPILCTFEHEPAGTGIDPPDLAVWSHMQTRMAYWFAGFRNCTVSSGGVVTLGSYSAAHDLSLDNGGNLGWAPVGNGFWWRSMSATALAEDRAAAYPPELITALNDCKGLASNDFYDVDYVNMSLALTDPAYRTPGSGPRTNVRIQNYITWARANGVNASGCGEYGVIDGPEMTRCWEVMRANRDIWCVSNYFNSQNNSDHERRIIPADYPAGNPTGSKGLVDFGGDAQSAGRLAAFKTTLTQSISSAYTGPLT